MQRHAELAQLAWCRLGEELSDLQPRDILGVLAVQDDRLDVAYLHQWGESQGTNDLAGAGAQRRG